MLASKNTLRAASIAVIGLVALTGCGKGSNKNVAIQGVKGPNVSFVDNTLTMSVTLTQVSLDFGGRLPVPKMPNSYLEVGPDFQSNGTLISIGISALDVKALAGDSINLLDPTTLPGGRALPGVAAGELPGLAVQVPKWDNVTFYVGSNVLGVFVPVVLPFQNYMGTFRFYDPNGVDIGNISIVGEDNDKKNSGFLLLINLSGTVGKLIGM